MNHAIGWIRVQDMEDKNLVQSGLFAVHAINTSRVRIHPACVAQGANIELFPLLLSPEPCTRVCPSSLDLCSTSFRKN